jgi:hypothetical protein
MTNITTANGVKGFLLYVHGANTYQFRVYDGKGGFKDYDIYHCDLSITIDDADAFFYEKEDGRLILDHSPETLGIKK